ncbi:MarC family protein, partial [Alphaproteobacteria bacterium]|nr:MarC family protein [Alphaproteobacteria bacterium]
LAFFAVIGDFILDALNISQAAFRITGGGLLLFLGIDLVRGTAGGDPGKETDAAEKTPESVAVYP